MLLDEVPALPLLERLAMSIPIQGLLGIEKLSKLQRLKLYLGDEDEDDDFDQYLARQSINYFRTLGQCTSLTALTFVRSDISQFPVLQDQVRILNERAQLYSFKCKRMPSNALERDELARMGIGAQCGLRKLTLCHSVHVGQLDPINQCRHLIRLKLGGVYK